MLLYRTFYINTKQKEAMKKEEKKQYQKPEIVEHENLNEVTKGDLGSET